MCKLEAFGVLRFIAVGVYRVSGSGYIGFKISIRSCGFSELAVF